MRPRKILIVDDEANARSALAAILSDQGYRVETAADGLDALERAAGFAPDVVVTDMRMPRLDGIGLLERLRAAGSAATMLVLSALGIDLPTAIGGRAVVRLQKPVDLDELRFHLGAPEVDEAAPAGAALAVAAPGTS